MRWIETPLPCVPRRPGLCGYIHHTTVLGEEEESEEEEVEEVEEREDKNQFNCQKC